jgi:hypothetical protein
MNRIYLTVAMVVILFSLAKAQIAKNSVGLRYGALYGLGTEITYQRGLSAENRLEFDFGFNSNFDYVDNFRQDHNSWALTGLYHWVWKLKELDENVNWYVGTGGKLGTWSSNQGYNYRYHNGPFFTASGDVGIEYVFPAGIQFALNARPELGIFNHGSGVNIGFAVRYQFK